MDRCGKSLFVIVLIFALACLSHFLVSTNSSGYLDTFQYGVRKYTHPLKSPEPQITDPVYQPFQVNVKKTVIVSGVDSQYFQGALNLIGSIHFWEPGRQIIIYNLGLTKAQLDELSQICRVTVRWPSGIPSHLPKHLQSLKAYAWKIFAIQDAVDRYEKIFWMDGGSDVRAPLDKLDQDLEKDGFYFIGNGFSHRKVTAILHNGMLDYLGLKREDFVNKEVFAGGYQGYIKGGFGYFHILLPVLSCSKEVKCISPPGSNLGNHRYDQSALALTIHTSGINMTSRMHYDVEMWERKYFEKDHTIPSQRFIYTSRRHSSEYKKYIRKLRTLTDCQESSDKTYSCNCDYDKTELAHHSLESF